MKPILRIKRLSVPVIVLMGLPYAVSAAGIVSDKQGFTLFNPTPDHLLREMSTDRPDKTESPYTVDAGHFQFESDLVNYSHDHDESSGLDSRIDEWSIAPVNLKIGLSHRADLQMVFEPYRQIRTHHKTTGIKAFQTGFGDITTRLKVNLWGNDGGSTSFAVMPFLKFPTQHDPVDGRHLEGGVIFPLALELPAGFGLGLMTEFDLIQKRDEPGSAVEFINSVTLSRDIIGKLGGYVEIFTSASSEQGAEWEATLDLGLTYGLTRDIQLDAGVNLGLTDSADDINPFIGLSYRF